MAIGFGSLKKSKIKQKVKNYITKKNVNKNQSNEKLKMM